MRPDPRLPRHPQLARLARETALMKWSQLGFGRTKDGQKIQRRAYAYTDGIDPTTGLRTASTSTSATPGAACSRFRPGSPGRATGG